MLCSCDILLGVILIMVQFQALTAALACGGRLTATNSIQTLTSPNYPSEYTRNSDCLWQITSTDGQVKIMVQNYSIELGPTCSYDSLDIYFEGNRETLCGRSSGPVSSYTSQSNVVFVVFHSDDSRQLSGFELQYQNANAACHGGVAVTQASGCDQILTSPRYPEHYPDSVSCVWRIESPLDLIKLTLEDFQLHSFSNDKLVLTDAFNSTSSPIVTLRGSSRTRQTFWSSSNVTLIRFYSDGNGTSRGFKLTYKAVDKDDKETENGRLNKRKDKPGQSFYQAVNDLALIVAIVEFLVILLLAGGVMTFCCKKKRTSPLTQKTKRFTQEIEEKERAQRESNVNEAVPADPTYVNAGNVAPIRMRGETVAPTKQYWHGPDDDYEI